jgi:adenine-specific DNA methylase
VSEPRRSISAIPVPDAQAGTMLESAFPIHDLSRVIAADRRSRDSAYGAHRWFARRPPGLLRAILLAAALPACTSEREFWTRYAEELPALSGHVVYDPFVGGGSSLVEAGRLGAVVAGRDIDPVAIRLVRHELDPPKPDEFAGPAAALLEHLTLRVGHLYPSAGPTLPLHTFSIACVTCPACAASGPLYRSPVIARGSAKVGSVARTRGVTVFCPDCGELQALRASAKELRHCGRRRSLTSGSWVGASYTCPECDTRSTHAQLRTGAAPRWTLAIEETHEHGARTFRVPTREELASEAAAARYLAATALPKPTGLVPADNADGRPASYGMPTFRDLFTDRQLALFGTAFAWLEQADVDERVRTALRLAVSNALATNNRMCGYATEYGRLSALFSVRGYSLPALAVELNALHPTAGRGTLPRTLQRVTASLRPTVMRYAPSTKGRGSASVALSRVTHEHQLPPAVRITHGPAQHASRDDLPAEASPDGRRLPRATLVVTDPPYFDYIAYDTLSAFYRAWGDDGSLAGSPVLPLTEDPTGSFGDSLGDSLGAATKLLGPDGLAVFTYHSTNPAAWEAVGRALRRAQLRVTALWPVLADPHMGHHGTQGACQYDLVIVVRPRRQTNAAEPPATTADAWLTEIGLDDLPDPDQRNASLAFDALSSHWGTVG